MISFFLIVPGAPEYDTVAYEPETNSITLSWIVKCKNGIIQEYRIEYFSVDDSSGSKNLRTRDTKIQIGSLPAGKTLRFQVQCRLSTRNFIASCLQMLVNYLIMTDVWNLKSLGCVVSTILLPLKDLTLKMARYSHQPLQYELQKWSLEGLKKIEKYLLTITVNLLRITGA